MKSFQRTLTIVLTLLALAFSAVGVKPARAATTWTVTSLADSSTANAANCPHASNCRLRDAVAAASAGDTIVFASGLSGGTIYLASTLILSKNVTINGSALASKINISGDSDNNGTGNVRVFSINSSVNAILDSLIITKGNATLGGGLYVNSGILNLTNSTVSGNLGGGIYGSNNLTITNSIISDNSNTQDNGGGVAFYGTLNIVNSQFLDNTSASSGGGIANYGTLTVTGTTFSGNKSHFAGFTTGLGGGAIYNAPGRTATITTSTFSGNSEVGGYYGGAIYNDDGTLEVTNSTFSDNSSFNGGGITNDHGTVTITNTLLSGNFATDGGGGGIYNKNIGALTVINSTFSNNSASLGGYSLGGGIFNGQNSTLTLKNGTFSDNFADVAGGGVYNKGILNYSNTIMANSTAGGDCYNDAVVGAVIGINGTNLVEDSSCSASLSGDPDLAALANNGGPTQTMGLFSGSPAIDVGDDAICAAAPVNNLDQRGFARPEGAHCDIGAYEGSIPAIVVSNTNDNGNGSLRDAIANAAPGSKIIFDPALSGQAVYLSTTLTLTKNVIIDGSTLASKITISGDTDNDGSGNVRVFVVNSGVIATLKSLIITKGNADISSFSGRGGGVYNYGGTLTITNSALPENSAVWGGGVFNYSSSALIVTNSTFSGNSASESGGGIANSGALTIQASTFSNNLATYNGGGIHNNYSGTLAVTNSTIYGNSASSDGGGIYNYFGILTITNSTVSGNSAAFGGGVRNWSGTFRYSNTIIANSNSGGDCLVNNSISVNVNNLIEDGSCSDLLNSLSGDPKLGALADNGGPTLTMALNAGSLAIDAGSDAVCGASPVSGKDQRGVARPVGAHCDIGAYEGSLPDTSKPVVSAFTVPTTSASLSIPINTFTATDNVAVTGYKITTSSTPPSAGAAGWTASPPATFAVANPGTYTFYPWAKDAAGNVSPVFATPRIVTVDVARPSITAFNVPASIANLNVPISTFTAADNVAVTGYKVTTSSTPPGAGAAGWTVSAPTTFAVGAPGTYTLYPWAKDAAGNVSAVFGSPRTVLVMKERSRNGGFESYTGTSKIPTGWSAGNTFSTSDGKDTNVHREGAASVKIVGAAGKTKRLTQTINLSGNSGDKFVFSFWVRGKSFPAAGLCRGEVLFYNGATLTQTKAINCATATTAFQKKSLTFTVNAAYTKIVIRFTYSKASGTVWFDGVSLMK